MFSKDDVCREIIRMCVTAKNMANISKLIFACVDMGAVFEFQNIIFATSFPKQLSFIERHKSVSSSGFEISFLQFFHNRKARCGEDILINFSMMMLEYSLKLRATQVVSRKISKNVSGLFQGKC